MRRGRTAGLALALTLVSTLAIAPVARADVHDSLPDMLSAWVDMQEEPSPPWENAWLRYEAAQSSWLDPTLWSGRTPTQKAMAIDATIHEVDGGFGGLMHQVAAFEQNWGLDLSTVNDGLRREFGTVPIIELYVGFSMSPAKLAVGELGGHPSMALNVRRLLPYKAVPTRVLLARYMSEWAIARWQRSNPPTVADRLHLEGFAVWAAGRVLPGVEDADLLNVTAEQMRELETGRARFVRLVLAGLELHEATLMTRLFGVTPPAGWPPAAGDYVGLLVARDMAQELGQDKLMGMSHGDFIAHARRSLERLAAGSPGT